MARTSRTYGKNNWALFLLILGGIVVGSFLGFLFQDVKFLSWLNYGMNFAIGDSYGGNVISLDLGVFVIRFGMKIKITIGSIIGTIVSIIVYKKI